MTDLLVIISLIVLNLLVETQELFKASVVVEFLVEVNDLPHCHQLIVVLVTILVVLVLSADEDVAQELQIRVVFVQLLVDDGLFI